MSRCLPPPLKPLIPLKKENFFLCEVMWTRTFFFFPPPRVSLLPVRLCTVSCDMSLLFVCVCSVYMCMCMLLVHMCVFTTTTTQYVVSLHHRFWRAWWWWGWWWLWEEDDDTVVVSLHTLHHSFVTRIFHYHSIFFTHCIIFSTHTSDHAWKASKVPPSPTTHAAYQHTLCFVSLFIVFFIIVLIVCCWWMMTMMMIVLHKDIHNTHNHTDEQRGLAS